MTWLPIVDYAASWASPGSVWNGAPDPTAFAAFAVALVDRYGPGGQFWASNPSLPYRPTRQIEVWNEENAPEFWTPQNGDTPGRFYDLYAQTKAAVHAASAGVTVVFGGLLDSAVDPLQWLAAMNRQRPGSLHSIQSLGWHPYLYFLPTVEEHLESLRAFLDANGANNVPIEITELGNNTTFTSGQAWAQMISTLAARLPGSGCGVSALLPFLWQDSSGTSETSQGWSTLSTPGGQLTASGAAFAAAASSAAPTPAQRLCKGPTPDRSRAADHRSAPLKGSSWQAGVKTASPVA
jgi:hypothetical protein